MLYLNKHRPESIITWDWKNAPNWNEIETAINHINEYELNITFIPFEKNSDNTGNFPNGKFINSDEGKFEFMMKIHNNRLIMNFGEKPVNWIGFTKEETVKLIEDLSEMLKEFK